MWLAQLERLRDCLASWGLQINTCCCIYRETRDHLFLRCSFAEQLWKLTVKRLGYKPILFHTWEVLLSWIRLHHSSCPATLRKLTVQAVIYRISRRLHYRTSTPASICFKEIDRQIRNAILARKHRRKFISLMRI